MFHLDFCAPVQKQLCALQREDPDRIYMENIHIPDYELL